MRWSVASLWGCFLSSDITLVRTKLFSNCTDVSNNVTTTLRQPVCIGLYWVASFSRAKAETSHTEPLNFKPVFGVKMLSFDQYELFLMFCLCDISYIFRFLARALCGFCVQFRFLWEFLCPEINWISERKQCVLSLEMNLTYWVECNVLVFLFYLHIQ